MSHPHPFYEHEIIRCQEEQYIKNLMKKYQHEPVTEELKKKIWDELQIEKYKGNIKIPFKMVTRIDSFGNFPDQIEIILDTKV